MALEVKEEEEKGKGTGMTPDNLQMLTDLQNQIEELKKQNQSGQALQGGVDNQLLTMLVDKLAGREEIKTGQFEFNAQYSMQDIDPEDILPREEQVTFVCHKVGYVIADDQRNGKNVKAPVNIIKFKYASTKQVKSGRETDLVNLCTYTCTSKKELEWLKSHTLFGVTFFDKISTAMSSDVQRANKLAQHVVRLQKTGQHHLIEMAKHRGIDVGDVDLNALRAMLAHRIVEDEMAAEGNASLDALKSSKLEADLIERSVQ